MNSVLTRQPSSTALLARVVGVLLVSAIGLPILVGAVRLIERDVSYVRITVENPLPFLVNVEVAGAERDGWLDLASINRGRIRIVEEVLDQGDEWVFRFSYGGVQAGEVVIGWDELAREDWRITAPRAVADRLREAGLSESAM